MRMTAAKWPGSGTVRDGRPRSIERSTSTSAETPRSAAAVSTPDWA